MYIFPFNLLWLVQYLFEKILLFLRHGREKFKRGPVEQDTQISASPYFRDDWSHSLLWDKAPLACFQLLFLQSPQDFAYSFIESGRQSVFNPSYSQTWEHLFVHQIQHFCIQNQIFVGTFILLWIHFETRKLFPGDFFSLRLLFLIPSGLKNM